MGLTLGIATRSPRQAGHVVHETGSPRSRSLDPFEVLAGPGVDPDLLAGPDERGDLDLQAGLQGRFLVLVGGRRPRERRRGVGDGQVDEAGISIETGLSLTYLTITLLLGSRYCIAVPRISGEK